MPAATAAEVPGGATNLGGGGIEGADEDGAPDEEGGAWNTGGGGRVPGGGIEPGIGICMGRPAWGWYGIIGGIPMPMCPMCGIICGGIIPGAPPGPPCCWAAPLLLLPYILFIIASCSACLFLSSHF